MSDNNNCVFCAIINGRIPSYTVYEDEDFKVILDKFPASPGHTIIITKGHFENIYALPDDVAQRLLPLIKRVAAALKERFHTEGLNIVQNNGAVAGQTVMHFHVHLIPRSAEDGIGLNWRQIGLGDDEFIRIRDELLLCLK